MWIICLKQLKRKKAESMNAIKIIGNKLNLRESVIKGMRKEISLISDRIELNTIGNRYDGKRSCRIEE